MTPAGRLVLGLQIYGAAIAWGLHWAVARLLLKGMSVSSVPWSELLAHTGYSFFPVCLAIIAGGLAGAAGCTPTASCAPGARAAAPSSCGSAAHAAAAGASAGLCRTDPAGRIAYYVVWVYGSLSMGVFMVKCFKRVVQQERHYGACSRPGQRGGRVVA
jgi:hypothetical protein